MHKLITKYATAAHLALLAVSPLVLFPFFSPEAVANAIFYLSLYCLLWVFFEPSRRRGEYLHNSRRRAALEIFSDPILWLMLLFAILAGIRWLNGGIALAFDVENFVWVAKEPPVSILPASAEGHGKIEFAAALAAVVIVQGLLHAIGKSARVAFLFIGSFVAAIAAIIAVKTIDFNNAKLLASLGQSFLAPSFVGTIFGLWMLCAITALTGAIADEWKGFGFPFAFAIAGSALGLLAFAPPAIITVFLIMAIIAIFLFLGWVASEKRALGALKFLGIISISIAFSVLLALSILPDGLLAAKIEPFEKLEIFPSVILQERQVLAKIASKVWSENLWIGTGLGTFSLDVRFNAQPADWDILCTVRENAMNGWLNLAAERGLVGIVAFAIPLIMLVVAFIRRIPGTIRKTVFMPGCYLAFAALALIAAVTFFDTSLFSSSGVMSMSAVLALGVASIPPKRKETKEESSTEEKK